MPLSPQAPWWGFIESSPSPRVVAAAAIIKQNPRCQSPGVRAAKGKGTDFCLHPPLVPLPQWLNSEFGSCWIGVPPTSAQTSRGFLKGLNHMCGAWFSGQSTEQVCEGEGVLTYLREAQELPPCRGCCTGSEVEKPRPYPCWSLQEAPLEHSSPAR